MLSPSKQETYHNACEKLDMGMKKRNMVMIKGVIK